MRAGRGGLVPSPSRCQDRVAATDLLFSFVGTSRNRAKALCRGSPLGVLLLHGTDHGRCFLLRLALVPWNVSVPLLISDQRFVHPARLIALDEHTTHTVLWLKHLGQRRQGRRRRVSVAQAL